MKKISILLFAIMMAGSLSAQIEEVSAEQYAPKKEIKVRMYAQDPHPANLLKRRYNLVGQQLYCVNEYADVREHYSSPTAAIVIYTDGSIGLERLKKGSYYTVVDMLTSEEQLYELQNQLLQSKNYNKEGFRYKDINGKDKVYYISKTKKEDIPGFLKTDDVLYVLSDEKGVKYYISWRYVKDVNYVKRYQIPLFNNVVRREAIAYSASIGDFISVETFNYLKDKYTNKELVYCSYYDPSCQKYYSKEEYATEKIKKLFIARIEKVGVEKNHIVFLLNVDGKRSTEIYGNEGKCIPSGHKDTIEGVCWEESTSAMPMRTDIDSLVQKWYQEEQIKEAQARAEKAKQKAEYIKKYGEKFALNILDGKVCVGMTKEMCQEAMGKPDNTTRNSSSLGVVEMWTYSTLYELFGGYAPIIVITFLDDKVTSVDEYKENFPF